MAKARRKQQQAQPLKVVLQKANAGLSLDQRLVEQQEMSENLVILVDQLRSGAIRIRSNAKAGTRIGWPLREFHRMTKLVVQQHREMKEQQDWVEGAINTLKFQKASKGNENPQRMHGHPALKRDEDTCTVNDDRVSGVHHRIKLGSHADGRHRRR
jgi:hypothetical protein